MNCSTTILLFLCMATNCAHAGSTQRLEFSWQDINTRDVVRWEGDTAIVKPGNPMQEFSCKVKLETRDVQAAIESFGIPKAWTHFTYTDEADLQKQQKNIQVKAARHGISFDEDMDKYIVDYK